MAASKEQQKLMAQWFDHTGFEFMSADRVKADDPAGFVNLWKYNVKWLDNLVGEADRLLNDYRNRNDR